MRIIAITAAAALLALSGTAIAGPQQQQQQQQAYSQSQAASQSGNLVEIDQRNLSRNNVEGDDFPVAQAWAAPLTASNDTCMGSTSAGAQFASIGVSLGSTWRDGDCVRRKDSRLLHNMGLHGVAAALMCQKDNVAAAFEAAGVPCVAPTVQATRAIAPPVVVDELGETTGLENTWQFQSMMGD